MREDSSRVYGRLAKRAKPCNGKFEEVLGSLQKGLSGFYCVKREVNARTGLEVVGTERNNVTGMVHQYLRLRRPVWLYRWARDTLPGVRTGFSALEIQVL